MHNIYITFIFILKSIFNNKYFKLHCILCFILYVYILYILFLFSKCTLNNKYFKLYLDFILYELYILFI